MPLPIPAQQVPVFAVYSGPSGPIDRFGSPSGQSARRGERFLTAMSRHSSPPGEYPVKTDSGRSNLSGECRRLPRPVVRGSMRRRTALPAILDVRHPSNGSRPPSRSIDPPVTACESRELTLPTLCCPSSRRPGRQLCRGCGPSPPPVELTLTAIKRTYSSAVDAPLNVGELLESGRSP